MKLIIDISEEAYKGIKMGMRNRDDMAEIGEAVENGIPLPKGHGRLIDADRLWDSYHDLDYDFYEAFDLAETIIEKDGD